MLKAEPVYQDRGRRAQFRIGRLQIDTATQHIDGMLTLMNSYHTDFLPFFFSYMRYRVRHASSLNLLVVRSSARACRQEPCFLAEEEFSFRGEALVDTCTII